MTFIRYGLVQVLAYLIDMGGFLLLLSMAGMAPLSANLVCKTLAGLFAFAAHRRFTFRVHGAGGSVAQGIRYFALLALNIPLSTAVLAGLLQWFGHAGLSKLAADIIILSFTYWVSKSVVFARPANGQDGPAA